MRELLKEKPELSGLLARCQAVRVLARVEAPPEAVEHPRDLGKLLGVKETLSVVAKSQDRDDFELQVLDPLGERQVGIHFLCKLLNWKKCHGARARGWGSRRPPLVPLRLHSGVHRLVWDGGGLKRPRLMEPVDRVGESKRRLRVFSGVTNGEAA